MKIHKKVYKSHQLWKCIFLYGPIQITNQTKNNYQILKKISSWPQTPEIKTLIVCWKIYKKKSYVQNNKYYSYHIGNILVWIGYEGFMTLIEILKANYQNFPHPSLLSQLSTSSISSQTNCACRWVISCSNFLFWTFQDTSLGLMGLRLQKCVMCMQVVEVCRFFHWVFFLFQDYSWLFDKAEA